MKILIPLVFLCFLLGCTSTKSIMESWLGSPIDSAVSSWGAPSSRMLKSDGGETYTWRNIRSNQYRVWECTQSFTTNSAGYIVGYSYNGC
jgi:hypothetical protein